MATQVDERIVSMQFNNSQFEASANTTLNTIDRLKQALTFSDTAQGFNNITTAANNVNLSGLGNAVDSIKVKFSALEVAALSVMANLVNQAAAAGAAMIRSLTIAPIMQGFNEYELKMGSIQTIMANVNATSTKTAKATAGAISSAGSSAAKSAASSSKQAQKDLQKAQKDETKAFQTQAEAELKEFNKTAQAEVEAMQEAQSEQLEELSDGHADQLAELQKSQKAELKTLQQGYQDELDALSDKQNAELDMLITEHNQKLDMYEEEYLAKVKSIDEERYNELKAIQDQIDALNELTEAEQKARKDASKADKLQTLQEAADKARSAKRREETEKALSDYKAQLAEEEAQEARKVEIEQLKEQMENVKTVYDEKMDAAKEEYQTRKELESTSYTDQLKAVKEYYAELKTAEQESYAERLEALQEQQSARREALNEEYEDERKELQKSLNAQLDALREQQDAQRNAIQDRQDEERDALNERQQAEMEAISGAAGAAGGAVGGVTGAALGGIEDVNQALKEVTLEDVNKALDELNTYADKTIYSFSDMTSNIGKFVSAGVGLDDSVASIKGFSNIAALAGATSQKTSNAMYQLSQGIAAGVIQLQDWRSMETNDVNSKIFQESLMETARVHGVAIDDMLAKEGTFRLTLQHGWLTSDIMVETLRKFTGDLKDEELAAMGYTDEQIKKIQEQAKNALDAATKVRTFSQLIGTMREAVGSGWAKTFELIIGNFDEATELFTNLNNVFSEIIDNQAEKRNELLEDWNSFGGRNVLIEGFKNMWNNLLPVVEAVQEGFHNIFPEKTAIGLFTLTTKFAGLTTQLKLSEDAITNVKKTVQGVSSIFRVVTDTISAFVDAVIPAPKTIMGLVEAILGLTGHLGDMVTSFSGAIIQGNVIGTVFKTLGKLVDGAVISITNIINKVTDWVKMTFPVPDTSFIGKFTSNIDEGLSPIGGLFQKVLESISNFQTVFGDTFKSVGTVASTALKGIEEFVTNIGSWLGKIPGMIVDAGTGIKNGISDLFSGAGKAASSSFSIFKEAISYAWDFIKNMFENFKNLPDTIIAIGTTLGTTIGQFFHNLLDNVSFGDLFKGLAVTNSVVGAKIGLGFSNILKGLGDALKSGENIFDKIRDSIKGVGDSIRDLADSLKKADVADIISEVSKAMAILALSLLVLSQVDTNSLGAAFAAVTIAMGELAVIVQQLSSLSSSSMSISKSGIVKTGSDLGQQMLKLAEAMLVVSVAAKILGTMDSDQIDLALQAITIFAGEAIVAVGALQKLEDKGGSVDFSGIMSFAKSLVVLGVAMKLIGSLTPQEWISSMTAIGLFAVEALLAVGGVTLIESYFKGNGGEMKGFISFAESLVLLGVAMRIIGGMKPQEWITAMTAIGIFAVEATAAVATVTFVEGKLKSTGGNMKGFISFAESMILLGVAMRIIGGMSPWEWEQAMTAIEAFGIEAVAVVSILTAVESKCGQTSLSGLKTFVGSLIAMGLLLKVLADLSWGSILSGLTAMAGSAAIMVVAMKELGKITKDDGFKPEKVDQVAESMIKLAAALLILTPVIAILGNLELTTIAIGLGAIAAVLAELGVAAALLGPYADTINKLAIAIKNLGIGVAGVGAGLALFAAGLLLISAAAPGVVANFLVTIGGIVDGFLEILIDAIPKIGELATTIITTFCAVLVTNAKAIADTFIQVAVLQPIESASQMADIIINPLVDLILKVIYAVNERVPELVHAIMTLVTNIINSVMAEVKNIDMEPFIKSLEGMGIISALIVIIAGVGQLAGPAATGLVKVGLIVAELIALLALMGGINQIPGVAWLVSEGSELLYLVGNAIGRFVGGIIGGFGEGVTASLPAIGKNLSDFIDAARPFFDGIKDFKPETAQAVGYLAEAILILTASNVLDAITKLFTGGKSSLSAFGDELGDFAPGLKKFADSVSGINAEEVEGAAAAAKMLAEMAAAIPNEGGLVARVTGDNSLSKFAEELVLFGPSLMLFALSVHDLNTEDVTAGVNSAQLVADFAKTIPNEGGFVAKITGDNSLSKFSEELVLFGPSIALFAQSVHDLNTDDVTAGVASAQLVADFAKTLENHGGLVSLVTGDNSLSRFAAELVLFGPSIKLFALSVKGINLADVATATAAASMIAGVNNTIPDTSLMKTIWSGDKSLSKFASEMALLGPSIKSFANSVEGIKPESATIAATVGLMIAHLNDALPDTGGIKSLWEGDQDLGAFGDNLKDLGKGIADFCNEVSGLNIENLDAVIASLNSLVDLATRISTVDSSKMSTFGADLTSMANMGIQTLIDAFTNCADRVTEAVHKVADYIVAAVNDMHDPIYTAGLTMGETTISGLEEGISTNLQRVIDAAKTLCETLYTNTNNNIKQSDYVTKGMEIVTWLSQGITNNLITLSTTIWNLANTTIINTLKLQLPNSTFLNISKTQIIAGLVSGLTAGLPNLKSTVETVASRVVSYAVASFDKDRFKPPGEAVGTGIAEGINSSDSTIKTAITTLAGNIYSYLDEQIDEETYKGTGKNIIDGIIKGIDENQDEVMRKARELAESVSETIDNALVIGSPSKVTRWSGQMVGEGLALGMEDMIRTAEKTGLDLSATATDPIMVAIEKISDAIENSDSEFQPTITPVVDLSNVNDAAGMMSGLFGSLPINTSASLAQSNAAGFRSLRGSNMSPVDDAISKLNTKVDSLAKRGNFDEKTVINNTFNIRSTDPKQAADEIGYIMQHKIERRRAAWAR